MLPQRQHRDCDAVAVLAAQDALANLVVLLQYARLSDPARDYIGAAVDLNHAGLQVQRARIGLRAAA